ncbi:MAG: DNA translocase FtsK 4TM domain-containing protein [Bdellovibrionota bacterium]
MYHSIMESLSRSFGNTPTHRIQKIKKNSSIEASSIILFAFAIFTLFALLTFSPSDPSIFSNVKGNAVNACGRIGAYLSSLVLQWFGMGAFLLPAAFFFLAAVVHKREGAWRVISTLVAMFFTVMSLTVFLSIQWKYWPYSGALLLTGGLLGTWAAELLVPNLNSIGASIASLLVFFVSLALSTPISVARAGAVVIKATWDVVWSLSKYLTWWMIKMVGLVSVRVSDVTIPRISKPISRYFQDFIGRSWWNSGGNKQRIARSANISPLTDKPFIGLNPVLPVPPSVQLSMNEYCDKKLSIETASEPLILPRYQGEAKPIVATAEKMSSRMGRGISGIRWKRGQWKLPTLEFLLQPPKVESSVDQERLLENSKILTQKFLDFGIDGRVVAVRPGPVITLYEFSPGPGVKISRIAALADDLSMALSAQSVRIIAPLPGKSVVGIEIPSENREIVYLREFLQSPEFYSPKNTISVVMGKDTSGEPYISDLAKMPHLLCAGQTGAGKSVFMNSLICSFVYRFTPDELRMILVDPKFIEFRAYQDIPHLLLPVVDDPKQASTALKWAVREMERRYRILAKIGVRNLLAFNQKVDEMGADVVHDLLLSEENNSESPAAASQVYNTNAADWMEAFEPDETGAPKVGRLPYIVIIIDELADLMMIARKEVEVSIARIAQKARAAGIHLIVATQRPSTDVITGLIKANLPSRVSFQLASYIDSKTILDRAGAERLVGQGDMLFSPPGMSQIVRLHGAYVDDDEISKITSFLRAQDKPLYRNEILIEDDDSEDSEGLNADELDELFENAVELVKSSGHASASFLQRHLKIGYNRAARMIETMEARGIVGPADGARPREVLLP